MRTFIWFYSLVLCFSVDEIPFEIIFVGEPVVGWLVSFDPQPSLISLVIVLVALLLFV